jgi:vancomycin resistance protein VanW
VSRRLVAPGQGTDSEAAAFPVRISQEQPILATDYVQAKIHNITLAARYVENLPVPPQGIFSFWHVVGPPSQSRGFQPGRSLLGGQLRTDYGGGLCQLSGLLYYVSIVAGLEITERHPHSRDIYDDNTRYAPLGSDATVAYGFKDLRILNTTTSPICFRVWVSEESVRCDLCSPAIIESSRIEFARTPLSEGVTQVETRSRRPGDADYRVLNISVYRRV